MLIDLSGKTARAVADYQRPYEDPIAVSAGDAVMPDFSRPTDLFGWVWCKGPDGREGWAPRQWLDPVGDGWIIRRDFNALELTLAEGDMLFLDYGESGFVMARTQDGRAGWAPMGVLKLVE